MQDDDNIGLQVCMEKFDVPGLYDKVKHKVSLVDFFVIIAEVASARASNSYNEADFFAAGTLAQKFRDGFKYGRRQRKTCHWNTHRMPNPEHGCNGADGHPGLKQIFVDNIYKDHKQGWMLTAAISGAHTVGKVSLDTAGYNGHWSDEHNSGKFNNDYFKSLIMKGWIPEPSINGNSNKNQW